MPLDPTEDIRRLAREYGFDVRLLLDMLAPFFGSYLELAIEDEGFEVITGGVGIARELARAAASLGLDPSAIEAFLGAAATYPDAMLGLKVDAAGRTPPTLYHRTMLPLERGLELLACNLHASAIDALAARLAPARTLYGLGFTTTAGRLRVKTYVLDEVEGHVGFRSVRVTSNGVEEDERLYEAEAPVRTDVPVARLAAHVLGVNVLGHVASSRRRGTKVYVERVGAIPTDFAAR